MRYIHVPPCPVLLNLVIQKYCMTHVICDVLQPVKRPKYVHYFKNVSVNHADSSCLKRAKIIFYSYYVHDVCNMLLLVIQTKKTYKVYTCNIVLILT